MVDRHTYSRQRWCSVLLISALACLLCGCGIKAPPRPPTDVPPPPQVGQLAAELEKKQVVLTWRYRPHTNQDVQGFGIYRYRLSLNREPCTGCPLTFEKIGDVPVGPMADTGIQYFQFVHTPDTGFHYQFKIAAYMGGGVQGPFSDPIKIDIP